MEQMIDHFLRRDFNVTPNSTAGCKAYAVEALDLGGRYSASIRCLSFISAVEAPDLEGRYSILLPRLLLGPAVEALDLEGRYSPGYEPVALDLAVEALDLGGRYSCNRRTFTNPLTL